MLMRLTRQGIVRSERVGNAYSHQLNRDHLAAGPIIELAHVMCTLLRQLEQRLESWAFPPVYAAIFPSAARGTITADSDLDMLLVRSNDTPLTVWDEQVHALAAEVTRWTGNDARPFEYAVSELNAARAEPVLREGQL